MRPVFSISSPDITKLNDDDLRELIGLLSAAELQSNGYQDAPVRYGGHQDAPDGGVDVRVEAETLNYKNGYVPRAATIFQVKVPKMTDSKIGNEMRPKGVLLQSISALAGVNGAYVIVSAKANYTDSEIQARRKKMLSVIGDFPIHVDYYDSHQVAKWANRYPSLVAWVKNKLGEGRSGWVPYGNWARVPVAAGGSYLVDEGVLLIQEIGGEKKQIKGEDALNYVRDLLRKPGVSVRVVGLSGVGKTRFIQALFEDEVGERSLCSSTVIYTDSKENPQPNPGMMLKALQQVKWSQVLIVDNCSGDVHRELTEILKSDSSQVSLLTVEYDIREDDFPEGSTALKLAPASEELIGEVLKRMFPDLLPVAIQRIASISGGNFRVAKAIGERIAKGEDLSHLKDEQLFERIFFQGREVDKQLLAAAELLSLVYSFNRNTEEVGSELEVLSSLGDVTLKGLRRQINELIGRDVIQERGHWGAVLPPAIANRLAARALKNFSIREINACFLPPLQRRLLKSLANRLGYIKGSTTARALAEAWLEDGGFLADVTTFDRDTFSILKDVAIVAEVLTLSRLEEWTNEIETRKWIRSSYHLNTILGVVVYLAYDAVLFDRALSLLLTWYSTEDNKNGRQNQLRTIATFFQLYLSGTQANPITRSHLLLQTIHQYREDLDLVKKLLDHAFEFRNVTGHPHYTEGKTRADYGYRPKTKSEEAEWYRLHLDVLKNLIEEGGALREVAIEVFDVRFWWLYPKDSLRDQVLELIKYVEETGGWSKGWVVIERALSHYKDHIPSARAKDLKKLRDRFAPTNLKEQIATFLHFKRGSEFQVIGTLDPGEGDEGYEALRQKARKIGEEVAHDLELLDFAFSGLLKVNSFYRGRDFGEAVGRVIAESDVYPLLAKLLTETPFEDILSYDGLRGLMVGLYKNNQDFYHEICDAFSDDDNLLRHLLPLQLSHTQDERDLKRLEAVTGLSDVFTRHYRYLDDWARTIPDSRLAPILMRVGELEGGGECVLQILYGWAKNREEQFRLSDDMLPVVTMALASIEIVRNREGHQRRSFYLIKQILKLACAEKSGLTAVIGLLEKIRQSLHNRYGSMPHELKTIIEEVADFSPNSVLEVFVRNVPIGKDWRDGSLHPDQLRPLITALPSDLVEEWIAGAEQKRVRELAYCITPFTNRERKEIAEGWLKKAWTILEATASTEILSWLGDSFRSTTSVGNEAASAMALCLPLVEALSTHPQVEVRKWASVEADALTEDIAFARSEEFEFWGREEAEPRFE